MKNSNATRRANIIKEAMAVVIDDPNLGHPFLECADGEVGTNEDDIGACDGCRALARANRRLNAMAKDLRSRTWGTRG